MRMTRLPHEHKGSLVSGAFLIAGTSIGAGMLALPSVTGACGFVPAMIISVLAWAFMLCTGLLFLEVTLWSPDGSNVLTMTRLFLGPWGQWIGGLFFLFLYYCLLVSYISGGAPVFAQVIEAWTGAALPRAASLPLFTILFGAIIWIGPQMTGRINFLLLIGLILTYVVVISLGLPAINATLLSGQDWSFGIVAAATLFSAYGYHNVVPSVATLLRRDGRRLRRAICLGTGIVLVVYTLWQLVIIGVVPQERLLRSIEAGNPVTTTLAHNVGSAWIPIMGQYFSLFAIITSFLGVSLSMVDFIGDGTRIPRIGWGRLLLCLLVLVPPALLSWFIPNLFFLALRYAGGLGEATLNGILPALMVWVGRYVKRLPSDWRLPGGRVSLSILLILGALLFIHECISLIIHLFAA